MYLNPIFNLVKTRLGLKMTYRKIIVKLLDFLLELVEIHVIDVERLSAIGKNLLFDVSRRSFALALSRLAAEINDEILKKM